MAKIIYTKFNSPKTTQAACRLLHKNGGKMNYMKLIKELYLIDRICLDRWNRTLTGDAYFSMKQGPVLSNVLDNINSYRITDDEYWTKHIGRSGGYDVALKMGSCPNDELSVREKEVIDEVFKKFEKFDEWDIADWCHKNLKEWTDLKKGRVQILIKDILRALGKTREEIDDIEKEISSLEFAKQAFDDE